MSDFQKDNDYFRERDHDRVARYLALVGAGVAVIILIGLIIAFLAGGLTGPSAVDTPRDPEEAAPARDPSLRILDDSAIERMMARPDVEAPQSREQNVEDQRPGGLGTVLECASCPELTVIEPGVFIMGLQSNVARAEKVPALHGPSETPSHGVKIKKAYGIGTYEVTRRQFAEFANATGYDPQGCIVQDPETGIWSRDPDASWSKPGFPQTLDHPVVCINYDDAMGYINWLNEKTNGRYRLPSETEWEYAARAGTASARHWGTDRSKACDFAAVAGLRRLGVHAWKNEIGLFKCEDLSVQTAPVGSHKPNQYGLYDILGNVQEWVSDCWAPNYRGVPTDGLPREDGDCSIRILRGGSWDDSPVNVRAGRRLHQPLDARKSTHGFRVARDLKIIAPQQNR